MKSQTHKKAHEGSPHRSVTQWIHALTYNAYAEYERGTCGSLLKGIRTNCLLHRLAINMRSDEN